jgi:membrane associated rhomboid family serine protease
MRARRFLSGTVGYRNARVPTPIGLLMGLILVATIVASAWLALGVRLLLLPQAVWRGEVWRLLTWVFLEPDPISFIFLGLTLYWFGRELVALWGPARFFVAYALIGVVTGIAVCVVARFLWPTLLLVPRATAWPAIEGLLVAWGLRFPTRELRLFGMLRLTGRGLVWLFIATTLLFGLVNGFVTVLPHLLAQLTVLIGLRGINLRRLWLRARLALYEWELRRRTRHLRVVRRDDDRPRWTH